MVVSSHNDISDAENNCKLANKLFCMRMPWDVLLPITTLPVPQNSWKRILKRHSPMLCTHMFMKRHSHSESFDPFDGSKPKSR